jgi:hypothetical protein
VLQRRRLTLAAGPFARRVPLLPTLPPGALRVRLREVGPVEGPRLTDAVRAVTLRAPPRGRGAQAACRARRGVHRGGRRAAPGLYPCTLRAGRDVVAVATVRIT